MTRETFNHKTAIGITFKTDGEKRAIMVSQDGVELVEIYLTPFGVSIIQDIELTIEQESELDSYCEMLYS